MGSLRSLIREFQRYAVHDIDADWDVYGAPARVVAAEWRARYQRLRRQVTPEVLQVLWTIAVVTEGDALVVPHAFLR